MRRHVARVARRGRDARVDPRRLQTHRGMLAVVERVERVVRRTRMLGILFQDRRRNRAGLQRDGGVPFAAWNRGEQRQRIECRRLVVVRKAGGEGAHALGVRAAARRLVAGAVQLLHRVEVALLARGRRLGLPRRRVRRQPRQRRARLVGRLVQPERLIVRERFAPVRHRKAGVDLLRLPERVDGVVVLEAV